MNLKEIVLSSHLYGIYEASVGVRGPRCVTAQDIILPPYVEIVDNTQHIASLTEPIDLCIRLQLERNHNYHIKVPNNSQDVWGRVVSWASASTCGFKGIKRVKPFAAQTAVGNAIRTVVEQGMQQEEVMIKGPDLRRDAALRAIRRSGILLSIVRDVTPMPRNGCWPPKKRRV